MILCFGSLTHTLLLSCFRNTCHVGIVIIHSLNYLSDFLHNVTATLTIQDNRVKSTNNPPGGSTQTSHSARYYIT